MGIPGYWDDFGSLIATITTDMDLLSPGLGEEARGVY